MSTPTKWPWRIGEGRAIVGKRDDGKEISVAVVFTIVEYGDKRDRERADANARMMVAAPRLLATLDDIVTMLEAVPYDVDAVEERAVAARELINKVRAP